MQVLFFFKLAYKTVQTKLHKIMLRVIRTNKLKKNALMHPLCPPCGKSVQTGSNYCNSTNYKKPGNKWHVIEKSLLNTQNLT